jgi:L-ascorbate metabolism protein UlaG (beta-lactamase superfamily)
MNRRTATISVVIASACVLFLFHCVRVHTGTEKREADPGGAVSRLEDGEQQKNSAFQRGGKLNMSMADFFTTTWKFFFTSNQRTPKGDLPACPVDLSQFTHGGDDQLRVTWLGHSSVMINIDGFRLLTDPVFEKRVSIFGPSRFSGEVPIKMDQVPEIDAVIISHDHYDHLNRFSIKGLKKKAKRFLVPLGVGPRLERWGVPRHKIVELDWWQEHHLNKGLMVAATPAQHFSGRGLSDRNQTLWASWVVETKHHRLFFSGDSGYFDGFKEIGAVYGPFDLTLMECGAYNKAWAEVHMFPEETVMAHLDLKGEVLHPIHWGTFNLSLHPWYDPMERLAAAAKAHKLKTATPIVGDTTILDEHIPSTYWWRQVMDEPMVAGKIALPYASKENSF